MHRDEDCRQNRHLTNDLIDIQTHPKIRRTEMSEAIRLRPTDNLIEMREV